MPLCLCTSIHLAGWEVCQRGRDQHKLSTVRAKKKKISNQKMANSKIRRENISKHNQQPSRFLLYFPALKAREYGLLETANIRIEKKMMNEGQK